MLLLVESMVRAGGCGFGVGDEFLGYVDVLVFV